MGKAKNKKILVNKANKRVITKAWRLCCDAVVGVDADSESD